MERLGELASAGISLAVVAAVSTLNMVAGVVGLFAAEVNDSVLFGAAAFVMGTGTAIAGWALVLLVRLSNLVAGMEKTMDDHERRLGRVEDLT